MVAAGLAATSLSFTNGAAWADGRRPVALPAVGVSDLLAVR